MTSNRKKFLATSVSRRYYTIVDFPNAGEEYGRYWGSHPKQAANKAFSQLSRKINLQNSNDKNFMVFTIRELGTNKKHTYVGTRVKLHRPRVRNINGREVHFRYQNVLTNKNDLQG